MPVIAGINETTRQPQLAAFQYLNFGQRRNGPVKQDDLFVYLCERGVFRVGIEAECPYCALKFWTSLEDARMMFQCVYCGREFNSVAQLREFRYRRSGLFGRGDSQEGGIPVALTLLRFFDSVEHRWMTYTTGTKLIKAGVLPECETDFVVVSQADNGDVVIVIGECKTRGEITDNDIRNLVRVANALDAEGLRTYIAFSKLDHFTAEEIERFRVADQASLVPRIILLGPRELEPQYVDERLPESARTDTGANDFPSLVRMTRQGYLRAGDLASPEAVERGFSPPRE